jgi:hypothetical protein
LTFPKNPTESQIPGLIPAPTAASAHTLREK